MSTPLQEFSQKYFKRPDSWKGLLIMCGGLFLTKLYVDHKVKLHIFGEDGKGGQMLLMRTRHTEHDAEFREERKRFYWHHRGGRNYAVDGYSFNSKLDYQTLSYNNSHTDSWVDPKTIPHGHEGNNYSTNDVEYERFYKE
jgi:hypothetical protein